MYRTEPFTQESEPNVDLGEQLHEPDFGNPESEREEEFAPENEPELGGISDEEIQSDDVDEKIISFVAERHGGNAGEFRINKDYDSRNTAYFNEEGMHINTAEQKSTAEMTREWYKDKEPAEATDKRIADLEEANQKLFTNRNTLFFTNDREITIDGVKGLQVGVAICDSEGRVHYFNVDIIPAEENSEDDEDEVVPAELGANDNDVDSIQSENGDSFIGELGQISETDTIAVHAETTEEVIPESSEEVLAKTLTELFADPTTVKAPENVAKPSHSIIDQLAEQFGFTYGPEKPQNVQTVQDVESPQYVPEKIQEIASSLNESPKNENLTLENSILEPSAVIKNLEIIPQIQFESQLESQAEIVLAQKIEVTTAPRISEVLEVHPIKLIFKDEPKEFFQEISPITIEVPKFKEPVLQQDSLVPIPEKIVDAILSEEPKVRQKILTEYRFQEKEEEATLNPEDIVESVETITKPAQVESLVTEIAQAPQATELKKAEEPITAKQTEIVREVIEVTEKVISLVQERIDTKVFSKHEVSEQEEMITNDFVKRIERSTFVVDETTRVVRDENSVRNQIHERISSGRIGTTVADDTEVANDNEPELATSNGITMRRAA